MPLYIIEVSPNADREVSDAILWYEEKREGLGEAFYQNLTQKLQLISKYPDRYRVITGKFRQVSLSRFPYYIVYFIKPKQNIISVTSISHHKRNPKNRFK